MKGVSVKTLPFDCFLDPSQKRTSCSLALLFSLFLGGGNPEFNNFGDLSLRIEFLWKTDGQYFTDSDAEVALVGRPG